MPEVHDLVTLQPNTRVQAFSPGDTVKVSVKVKEGDRERLQLFQGVVLRIRGHGPGASFTVRRTVHGIGTERTFPVFSPVIASVEVVRRGDVRRARLYYLRGLGGRAARIKEKAMTTALGMGTPAEASAQVSTEVPVEAQEAAPAAEQSPSPEPVTKEPEAKA